MSSPIPSRQGQQGYILALSIAVLTLMLVGATYIGQRIAIALKLAQAEQGRIFDETALVNARAKILFLLAAVPRGPQGLGNGDMAVKLDGRYYQLDERVLVSLQDLRGLINVNSNAIELPGGRDRIERLLGTYGLDAAATRLTDELLDYRDADDLSRLNGAEAEDYTRVGKAALPRNDDLLSPGELGRILSWSTQTALWGDDPVINHVGIGNSAYFNPNTADWRVLVSMSGMTTEAAKGLISNRNKGDFADISRLAFPGLEANPFGMTSLVSNYPDVTIIVTLRPVKGNWGYRMAVTHTPASDRSPWHIQYAYRLALPTLGEYAKPFQPLPEASALRDFTAKEKLQLPFFLSN